MASVYIIYSARLVVYYTGSTIDLPARMEDHLSGSYSESYTSRANDWILYLEIPGLQAKTAREIEAHIKRMKSRIYIGNLKKYPEMVTKLIKKFS